MIWQNSLRVRDNRVSVGVQRLQPFLVPLITVLHAETANGARRYGVTTLVVIFISTVGLVWIVCHGKNIIRRLTIEVGVIVEWDCQWHVGA